MTDAPFFPIVSIIIPSYNGQYKLPALLSALSNQTFKDFECIVVVDGSEDHSVKWLREQSILMVNMVVNPENKGRAGSRNVGAEYARASLLVFFDDDMRPSAECVEKHARFYLKHKDIDYLLGGVQKEEPALMQTDIQQYKAALSEKWSNSTPGGQLTLQNLFLTSANMSVPARVFKKLNGFDTRLTDAEDFDLAVRAYFANIQIWYDDQNIAWHDDFITLKSYINRQRQYKAAHCKLLHLNPMVGSTGAFQPNRNNFFKSLIYKIFQIRPVLEILNSGFTEKILPKGIRYRMYDLLIYARSIMK